MKKIIVPTLIVTLMIIELLCALAHAEEGFTVAGVISFPKTGNLFIEMMTAEEFEKDHEQHGEGEQGQKQEAQFHVILEVGEKELEQKQVAFEFKNVPAGVYGIMCYQDVNGNGKLDEGTFGPKEPWGSYRHKRPKFRGPKFEEIQFDVNEDVTDIQFEIK